MQTLLIIGTFLLIVQGYKLLDGFVSYILKLINESDN